MTWFAHQDAADPGGGHRGGLPDRRDRDADRAPPASAAARCPGTSAPWCAAQVRGSGRRARPSSSRCSCSSPRHRRSARESAGPPAARPIRPCCLDSLPGRSQGCRQSGIEQVKPGGGIRRHRHGHCSFAERAVRSGGKEAGQVVAARPKRVLVEQPGPAARSGRAPRPGPGVLRRSGWPAARSGAPSALDRQPGGPGRIEPGKGRTGRPPSSQASASTTASG